MRPIDLEAVVPGYRQARQRERLNRALAFADVPWTICGFNCVHLTPTHRLELQLANNAFALDIAPKDGDVFQFLWRLNSSFCRPPLSLKAWWERNRIRAALHSIHVPKAVRAIQEYLVAMLQDMPEQGEATNSVNPPQNYVHWMASEARWFAVHMGMPLSEYKATPYLVLQQFSRAHRLATEESPQFINASDAIATEWHRRHLVKEDARGN